MNEFDSLTFLAERKKYGAHMKMIIKEMVKSQTCQKHKDALSVGGDVRKDDNNMARKALKRSSQNDDDDDDEDDRYGHNMARLASKG